jgi:deoxyribodipyrimidine photo-lyase
MASKTLINLATGLEDAERVLVAFLIGGEALEAGRPTAMFLTKDLLVDWRLGESYFMQKLTDGEIASNNGGWQWSAGTGADAAPYFRILNPWVQSARFDPEGEYVKRWVPELRNVPAERFFGPSASGERLVAGYPTPIVDHAQARARALELFGESGGTRATRE